MHPSIPPPLRPILAGLAPVLLAAFLVTLAGGCSSDAEPDGGGDGPTVTATAADETGTGSEDGDETEDDDVTDQGTDRPRAVEAVCAPYTAMVTAIKNAASESTDADEVAAEIGPVLKEFAAKVPGLERPPGLAEETWQGVVALADRIAALPDQPTDAEIEAVEGQLSPEQQEALEDASSWFRTNCA